MATEQGSQQAHSTQAHQDFRGTVLYFKGNLWCVKPHPARSWLAAGMCQNTQKRTRYRGKQRPTNGSLRLIQAQLRCRRVCY